MRIKTLFVIFGLLLGASLLLCACTSAATPSPTPAPLVLTDGLGRQFTIASPYQKVVSLAASNTEILFAIGAGDQVIARDAFSDYPEAALAVTDIGGGWGEIDMETVVALEPDLVLAAQINAREQVAALEQLGLKVFYLANPANLEGMFENLRIVARLTGHEEESEQLVASLQQRVQAVDEVIASISYRPTAKLPTVFYELDGTDPNAPWTAGPGTFIDLLIERAGGSSLGAALDGDWAQISIEALITQNPEIILLGDSVWGGITPEMVAARAGWDSISAVQNSKVYPFDDNLVSRPGPRNVDGLEAMAKLLHPADFD